MTTNREKVRSQTVAKNDAFAFRIWWQRALYCLASLPCIACQIPFWSSTTWGSRQSRFEPVARDRCSLHFSSFLSCHCHLRKSIRLIAHRKGLRASRTYRTLELHWTSFNFYNLVYACLRLLRWLPSGPCFKWWTAAVQGQTSVWCHAPLTLFRGSTSYLSKKPGNYFNPVDDSMLPAPIVGCPRLMWAFALRACWYCRGSYYLAPGFTCGSFQHIPTQYWIHHLFFIASAIKKLTPLPSAALVVPIVVCRWLRWLLGRFVELIWHALGSDFGTLTWPRSHGDPLYQIKHFNLGCIDL